MLSVARLSQKVSHTVQGCEGNNGCLILNSRWNFLHNISTSQRCASFKVLPVHLQGPSERNYVLPFRTGTSLLLCSHTKPQRSSSWLSPIWGALARFRHLLHSWACNCLWKLPDSHTMHCSWPWLPQLRDKKYCAGRNTKQMGQQHTA